MPPYMSYFSHAPHAVSPTSEDGDASSGPSSPVHSRFSSSSTASSSATSVDNGEYAHDAARAHLNYAKTMAQHTAAMWQKERLAIEKSKLDGTYTGNQTSRQNGNAKPPADATTAAPQAAAGSSPSSKCSFSSSSSGAAAAAHHSRRFVSALAHIPIFAAFSHSTSSESSPRGRSRIPKNRS